MNWLISINNDFVQEPDAVEKPEGEVLGGDEHLRRGVGRK